MLQITPRQRQHFTTTEAPRRDTGRGSTVHLQYALSTLHVTDGLGTVRHDGTQGEKAHGRGAPHVDLELLSVDVLDRGIVFFDPHVLHELRWRGRSASRAELGLQRPRSTSNVPVRQLLPTPPLVAGNGTNDHQNPCTPPTRGTCLASSQATSRDVPAPSTTILYSDTLPRAGPGAPRECEPNRGCIVVDHGPPASTEHRGWGEGGRGGGGGGGGGGKTHERASRGSSLSCDRFLFLLWEEGGGCGFGRLAQWCRAGVLAGPRSGQSDRLLRDR